MKLFRCAGCDQKMFDKGAKFIPWFRGKDGKFTESMRFCGECVADKYPGETGQALSKRIKQEMSDENNRPN